MLEICILGRGGQGAQTAGQILAQAFFRTGRYVQAFATYGGERRGAPVSSFLRVHDRPIQLRSDIEQPGTVICFDPSLLQQATVFTISTDTEILINSPDSETCFHNCGSQKILTIDALEIAGRCSLGRIVNSVMVGAFGGYSGLLPEDILQEVVAEYSPQYPERNIQACGYGYEQTAEKRGLLWQ